MSVYVAMGLPVSAMPNQCSVTMDRSLISRYKIDYQWDKAYIDFDDTIVVRGKVNLRAIWFLYQCKNENKQVVLLTKHKDEIAATLEKYAIPAGLFSSIVLLEPSASKWSAIDPLKAIFIDNAFQERADVAKRLGIPVFDVDGIEVLMDWRV
ncbi:MAG: carbamoylphosphate synthase large subunit short form, partial [Kiritimatiellae bacterium]|nr:carbamoylphosphate synthase large subunit short form [Kiritimatiellia bacterium]